MNHEEQKAWRQNLKEGSGVLITWRGVFRNQSIGIVQRTTATQIIVHNETGQELRFNKSHGHFVGDSYRMAISPITDAARAQIRNAKNREKFSSLVYRIDSLTDDEITVMLAAIQELRDGKAVQS